MLFQFIDIDFLANNNTGLRAAQQLIPGEKCQSDTAGNTFLNSRFRGKSKLSGIQDTTAAQIVKNRQIMLLGQCNHLLNRYHLGKSNHPEIAGMHAQQSRSLRRNRPFIVADISAIGGTHFDQFSATLVHNFRNTESTADFHCLTAGNDNLFSFGQGAQSQ